MDVLSNGDVAFGSHGGKQIEALEDETDFAAAEFGALGVGHGREVIAVHKHVPREAEARPPIT